MAKTEPASDHHLGGKKGVCPFSQAPEKGGKESGITCSPNLKPRDPQSARSGAGTQPLSLPEIRKPTSGVRTPRSCRVGAQPLPSHRVRPPRTATGPFQNACSQGLRGVALSHMPATCSASGPHLQARRSGFRGVDSLLWDTQRTMRGSHGTDPRRSPTLSSTGAALPLLAGFLLLLSCPLTSCSRLSNSFFFS